MINGVEMKIEKLSLFIKIFFNENWKTFIKIFWMKITKPVNFEFYIKILPLRLHLSSFQILLQKARIITKKQIILKFSSSASYSPLHHSRFQDDFLPRGSLSVIDSQIGRSKWNRPLARIGNAHRKWMWWSFHQGNGSDEEEEGEDVDGDGGDNGGDYYGDYDDKKCPY